MNFRCTLTLIICLCIGNLSFGKAAFVEKDASSFLTPANDTLSPKKVIIKFLNWYKINIKKANSFPILGKDSAGNFMINNTACAKYLNFLKSSKCLSRRYIAYWLSFFNDKAIGLQSNPIQSDIPEGFDLDWVLVTQEPELILDHIAQAKFVTISRMESAVVIAVSWPKKGGMEYQIEMHKNKEGWQIDYIATPNFD
ncbi:MAG: hypothetical protein ABIN94_01505 [Ferruginibacter sp.]